MAKPPVVRIMDYGKFKYRESKKQHEAKLKLKQIQVKECEIPAGGLTKATTRSSCAISYALPAGRRQGEDHLRFRGREMRTRNSAFDCSSACGGPRAVRTVESVPENGRPANGDAAGPKKT
jgi:translation initiation factor IF-3